MAIEIIFPRVDMDMASGRFSRWLVKEGGAVGKGEPLFEIETDKAAMEIDAPASGILRGVRVAEGEEVKVGEAVGWIVAEGEAWQERVAPDSIAEVPVAAAETPAAAPVAPPVAPVAPAAPSVPAAALLRATPLARREARRLNIDLGQVSGSGPRGRIVSEDLRTVASVPAPSSGESSFEPPVEPSSYAPARGPAGARLHRQWSGAGDGVPLVFLHGFGADGTGWRPVWRGLDSAHRLLAIDLPGHGRSKPQAPVCFDGLVDAVQSVLDEEGVRRCVLVGHSLGGAVALGLADAGVVDIRALCLLAPAGLGPEIDGAFLSGLVRATRAESLAPWLLRLVADPALVTPGFVRATLQASDAESADYRRRLIDSVFPDGTQAISLRHVLPQLAMPARIVWGTRDAIIPASHAAHLPGRIGLHRLDVGHMPHLEAPRLVAGLIAEAARSAVP